MIQSSSPIDWQETIVALSSASGPGARAIVRLTGDQAWPLLQTCFQSESPLLVSLQRGCFSGQITTPDIPAGLPVEALLWPGPRSYTGQDLAEIHTLSSPPLVGELIAHLLRTGARAARPGEFTMRAFLAGKLDLTQAEAVLGIIEAGNADELRTALAQLAGGIARPLHSLRDELLSLLAEVEAGLDFAEEDLQFISREGLIDRLSAAQQTLENLQSQLQSRTVRTAPFRVVLSGLPNAGKSSLFNALGGKPTALVSAQPGTTRDYLVQQLHIDGIEIELVDTAGDDKGAESREIDRQAQDARREQMGDADLVLLCHDAAAIQEAGFSEKPGSSRDEGALSIWTKCDLRSPPDANWLKTSAVQETGIPELRHLLSERARQARRPSALAPSWSRCRNHVEKSIGHLREGRALAGNAQPAELIAFQLRLALDQLGEMVGAVYTDDLLDRVFSQFCIGK